MTAAPLLAGRRHSCSATRIITAHAGNSGSNPISRCSFSAIVPILKSLTDFPDSGVDDLEPFRTVCDQRGKWRTALFRAIAYRYMLPFRALRCAEPAAGRTRNQGSDLVQVALIDRRVKPAALTRSTQPVRVPEGSPFAELPKREAMAGLGVFVSQ